MFMKVVLWLWSTILSAARLSLKLWHVFLLVILMVFLVGHFWRHIVVNLTEPEPSSFAMKGFPESYEGQYWLKLSGRLAVKQARMETARNSRPQDAVTLLVPLVVADWNTQQPVHAVIIFGPMDKTQVK